MFRANESTGPNRERHRLAVILIEAAHVAGRLATWAACWLPPVRPAPVGDGDEDCSSWS